MNAKVMLSEEVKNKLLELDRLVGESYEVNDNDPRFMEVMRKCRTLQNELMYDHGLSADQINDLTYGKEGLLYG